MIHRILIHITCLLLLAVCAGSPLAAAQDFTLTIPDRGGGNPQIARVKITFETLGAPITGTTLTIDGVSVPIGGAGAPDVVLGASAHPDHLEWVKSGSKLLLNLRLNSRVKYVLDAGDVAPVDKATLRSGVTGSAVKTISYDGSDITALRINSYTGGDLSGDTTADFKRVHTNAALIAPPAGVANLGRHPFAVCFVLDESGSMGLPVPGGGVPGTRWENLRSAVEQFTATWQVLGTADGTTTGGTEVDRDVVSLVFFASGSTALAAGDFWSRGVSGTPWLTPGSPPTGNVPTALAAHGPSTSTSIGAGLKTVYDQAETLINGVKLKDLDPVIILVTDGQQNTAPLLADNPGGVELPGVGVLAQKGFQVQTVGYGLPDASMQLLDKVSRQTFGRARVSFEDIATTLGAALVDAAKGNTLSTLLEVSGTTSQSAPATHALQVDASVRELVVVLRGQMRKSEMRLAVAGTAGGPDLAPLQRIDGLDYTVQRFDVPASAPAGAWSIRVLTGVPSAAYSLSAYSAEGKLDYAVGLGSARPVAGEPLTVEAVVGFAGAPLDALPAGALTVQVVKPGEGLGDLLHHLKAPSGGAPAGESAATPYDRKAQQLLQAGSLAPALAEHAAGSLTLAAVGGGRYRATTTDTATPGRYAFVFNATFPAPDGGGTIHRQEVFHALVQVRPDASIRTGRALSGEGGRAIELTITPKDARGHFQGPGYGSWFSVSGGTLAKVEDPDQTGVYRLTITGIAAGDPQITVKLGDDTVADGPVSQLAPEPAASGLPWWVWLLIALVVVLLLLLIATRKAAP